MASRINPSQMTIILIMGVTGVGKSTFIQYATGEKVVVGDGLEACTNKPKCFRIPDTNVFLVDTPGFDDTYNSDATVLKSINECLTETFNDGWTVSGVVYIHSIHDVRMKGSALKNLRMFEKVVGKNNLHKTRLVTTKWSLQDGAISEQRESELRTNSTFWKPLLARGSEMHRFGDTMESAIGILRPLGFSPPVLLQLTDETINRRLPLKQTEAGKEVNTDLDEAMKAWKAETAELQEQIDDAEARHDVELAELAAEERRKVDAAIKQGEEDRRILMEKYESKTSGSGWRWAARGLAATVAAGVTFVSGGTLAPAAIAWYGSVEAACQASKLAESF